MNIDLPYPPKLCWPNSGGSIQWGKGRAAEIVEWAKA